MNDHDLKQIIDVLHEILHGKTIPEFPPDWEHNQTLKGLYTDMVDMRHFLAEIAKGNLSSQLGTKGYLAGSLKMLQSNLNHLTWQTKMIASGDFTQQVDFMGDFAAAFNSMVAQLKSANEELTLLASQDSLTKVANRRVFDNHLFREWERAARNNASIAMILCDIDYFKQYNDTYGHQAGDSCLQSIADVMKDAVNRPVDLVVRYGGEEFAIVLPETELEGAGHLAETIRTNVLNLKIPHESSSVEPYVTVSAGVTAMRPERQNPGNLIKSADEALYEAKAQGRNRVVAQERSVKD